MSQLTNKEKETILKFSKNYIDLHNQIVSVEEEIKKLEDKSSCLIRELEDCRLEEKDFMDSLCKKYGPGQINPMNLCWEEKKLIHYAVNSNNIIIKSEDDIPVITKFKQSAFLFYEEASWYDGQIWEKPFFLIKNDKLISTQKIEPILEEIIKSFFLSLSFLFLVFQLK
jgi:hypothetical protein